MIRYYVCPMIDDGKSALLKGALGWHPIVMDLPRQAGQSIRSPGAHPAGWTLVVVDRPDHSDIAAIPQIDALLPELMGTVKTPGRVRLALGATPLGNIRTNALSVLNKYGIPTGNLATGRDFIDRVLTEIDPFAKLEGL